jgi:hypothetical protein
MQGDVDVKSRTVIIFSILLLLQGILPFVNEAEATSHGIHNDATDGFIVCYDTPNIGDRCDGYNSGAGDLSPNYPDWVKAEFIFEMEDTSTIKMKMNWAIHEFDRETLGMNDDPTLVAALESPAIGMDNNSGAPADMIRNLFDENLGGDTVRNQLIGSVNSTVAQLLTSFGSVDSVATSYIDSFFDGSSTTECTTDRTQDSEFEGLPPRPGGIFYPPICFSTDATIDLGSSTFSLGSVPAEDLERAFQGMVAMGAEIDTQFEIFADPGFESSFRIIPPAYTDVIDAKGGLEQQYFHTERSEYVSTGFWTLPNLNGVETMNQTAELTMGHKATQITPGVSIDSTDPGMEVKISLNLENEAEATLEVVATLSHIDKSTMNSWGVNLVDNDSAAEIPWITSDGIRMAYHNGLIPTLDDLLGQFDMSMVGEGLSAVVPGTTISMSEMSWVESSDLPGYSAGGLNYTHTNCPDMNTLPDQTKIYFCTTGQNAMSSAYPIYLRSVSNQTFDMRLLNMIKEAIPDDPTGLVEAIDENDLRLVLNGGLTIDALLGEGFLTDMMAGSDMPSVDITFEIVLPTWIASESESSTIILVDRVTGVDDMSLKLGGAGSYSWNHPICRSNNGVCANPPVESDVLCTALEKTCVVSELNFDLAAFDINEWTQSLSITFSLDASVSIYRVVVPQEIRDNLSTESATMDLEVLPADLLKLVLDIAGGPDVKEKFNTTIPLGDSNELVLEVSSAGFSKFADDLGPAITTLLHESSKDLMAESNGMITEFDLSSFRVATTATIGTPGASISDLKPISFGISIPKVTFTIGIANGITGITSGDPKISITTDNLLVNPLQEMLGNVAQGMGRGLMMGFADVSLSGVAAPEFQQAVDPIDMTIYEQAELDLDGVLTFTMPKGIVLAGFSTASGKGIAEEDDEGRQVITYQTKALQTGDTITFTMTVTWGYIISQIWIYPAIMLSFVVWRVYKRKQKKAKKLTAKATMLDNRAKKGGLSDSEFSNIGGGYVSKGVGGPGEGSGADAWSDMGGSGFSGGSVDQELLDLYD